MSVKTLLEIFLYENYTYILVRNGACGSLQRDSLLRDPRYYAKLTRTFDISMLRGLLAAGRSRSTLEKI